MIDGNYKEAFVFKNSAFTRNIDDDGLLDAGFFGHDFYRLHTNCIRKLKFNDFFRNGRICTRDDLANLGLPVSVTLWMRLRAAGALAWIRLRKTDNSDMKITSIESFVTGYKRGSKRIRKILEDDKEKEQKLPDLTIVRTFYTLTGSEPQDNQTLKNCLAAWRPAFLQNNMREFIFKFRNNQLALNNRVNAYDNTVDPRCSFCKIIDYQSTTRENFKHLFLTCPVTRVLMEHFILRLEPVPNLDTVIFEDMYWFGRIVNERSAEPLLLFIMDCFRFTIWNFKVRRKVPNWPLFERELLFLISSTANRNTSLKYKLSACNLIANYLPAHG